jgi:hypothetical protein
MKHKVTKPEPVSIPLPVQNFERDYLALQKALDTAGERLEGLILRLPKGSSGTHGLCANAYDIRASQHRMALIFPQAKREIMEQDARNHTFALAVPEKKAPRRKR